jgi:protoheme IX farnesyltransferase
MKKNNGSYSFFKIILQLVKFRLSLLVTFSAVIGYLLARGIFDLSFIRTIIGVLFLAGGSSALNQYQERNIDKLMPRTIKRPIPSGRVTPSFALFISLLFIVSGFFILLGNGNIPAILGILNSILYNLLYTPLKRTSPLSILPGAIVGAIPPMIGWTSAGGYIFHPNIVFVAIFMFSWQIPHFWLLMIIYGKQYEIAGLSSISKYFNENQIKYLVFIWTVITSVFIFMFPVFGIKLNNVLAALLIILNIYFIWLFYKLIFQKTNAGAIRQAFIAINSFMMLVLLIFILNLLG